MVFRYFGRPGGNGSIGAPQRFIIHSNWKIGADNFVGDSYHTMVTHGSIVKLGMVPSATYSKKGYQIYTDKGHGLNLGTPNPDFAFPEELKKNLSLIYQQSNMTFCLI